jgi:REP element-mobilizing transposase RayT
MSVNYLRNKNVSGHGLGPNYNFQHLVFTTKYRNPVFDDGNIIEVAREAICHAAAAHHLEIKALSFGEDYAHVHVEVNIPNTMTVAYAAQMLKGYSSRALFQEIPSLRTEWFWGGEFWGKHYGNGSVGPQDENTVQNYIKRQDISRTFGQCDPD